MLSWSLWRSKVWVLDDHIGHELAVLDYLALLVPKVFGDSAVAAEHQPLREVIELLALIRGGMDNPAQFEGRPGS